MPYLTLEAATPEELRAYAVVVAHDRNAHGICWQVFLVGNDALPNGGVDNRADVQIRRNDPAQLAELRRRCEVAGLQINDNIDAQLAEQAARG
jgi:hypothetical protein